MTMPNKPQKSLEEKVREVARKHGITSQELTNQAAGSWLERAKKLMKFIMDLLPVLAPILVGGDETNNQTQGTESADD